MRFAAPSLSGRNATRAAAAVGTTPTRMTRLYFRRATRATWNCVVSAAAQVAVCSARMRVMNSTEQKQQLEQYQEQEQVAAEALHEALRERVR